MKKSMLTVLVLVVCTLLLSASAFAAVKCANTTGSSGCYVSINGAIGAASAGDTVMVWPGVYNENVGVGKNNLTIMGGTSPYAPAAPGTVIVDAYDGAGYGFDVTADNVTIKNLTVRNGQDDHFEITGDNAKLNTIRSIGGTSYAIYIEGDAASVVSSYIFGSDYDAIEISGAAGAVIQKNIIRNTYDYAIYAYNSGSDNPDNLKIIQNEIYVADGDCIYVYGENSTNPAENLTITDNKISNCDGDGIYGEYLNKAYIARNTIWAVEDDSMDFDYLHASKIERNTLYSNYGYAIDADNDSNDPADANIYTYNNCYDLYDGFYIEEDFPTITYNTVKNVQGCEQGIEVDCYNAGCVGGVVAYNSVSNIACDYDCYEIDHDGMAIQNNTAELCSEYGFEVTGNNNTIMNNKSKYAGYGDDCSGFYVDGYGNTLTANTAEYSGYFGFEIYSDDGTNTLTGNTAQYNTWAGIYI